MKPALWLAPITVLSFLYVPALTPALIIFTVYAAACPSVFADLEGPNPKPATLGDAAIDLTIILSSGK